MALEINNQYDFFKEVLLDDNGALVVSITGGTGGGASNWTEASELPTTGSTSQMFITDSTEAAAEFAAGTPIRYKLDADTDYSYGQVTAYIAGTINIRGAALSGTISVMEVGGADRLYEPLATWAFLGSAADAASTTLFSEDQLVNGGLNWQGTEAYLIGFSVDNKSDDTGGSQPRFNISVGGTGNTISTSNSNAGLQLIDALEVSTEVDIDTANYGIAYDDSIEVSTDANGTNGDAKDIIIRPVIIIV